MPRVFHQNMRTFGGGAVDRNGAFAAGFGQVRFGASSSFSVAGLTEILNDASAIAESRVLLGKLNASLSLNMVTFQVGTTALGNVEFLVIAWDKEQMEVEHVGLVMLDSQRGWQVESTPIGQVKEQTVSFLRPSLLDYRGFAFIAARGQRSLRKHGALVFAFFHNMYGLGDRTAAAQSAPEVMQKIVDALGGNYAAAQVQLGGDFNVLPTAPIQGPDGPMPAPRRRERFENIVTVAARDAGGFVNTTASNPYDYWMINRPASFDKASVHLQTRRPGASDHAGISMEID